MEHITVRRNLELFTFVAIFFKLPNDIGVRSCQGFMRNAYRTLTHRVSGIGNVFKEDNQCTYSLTLGRVRVTVVAAEKQ